jgi:hypothetical protein
VEGSKRPGNPADKPESELLLWGDCPSVDRCWHVGLGFWGSELAFGASAAMSEDAPTYDATVDSDIRRRFNRAHISRRDFKKAIGFIGAAMKHDPASIEYEALMVSAIVYYARPFSGNERGKTPPSDPYLEVDVAQLLGDDDFRLHDRIVKMRNKAVAHSEFDKYPVQIMAVPEPNSDAGFTASSQSWHVLNERIDLDVFKRIAEALHQKCLNLCFDLGRAPHVPNTA